MMAIIVGFTGTRKGMSVAQNTQLRQLLSALSPVLFVHGGCVGADMEADAIAAALGIDREIHPSNLYTTHAPWHVMHARKGSKLTILKPDAPLIRNHRIVDKCDLLIACPAQKKEVLRSGTWATIRYARCLERFTKIL